jgi:hypothetical protein
LANRCTLDTLTRGIADIDVNFDGPIGVGVPESVRDSKRLYEAYRQLAERVATESPWCVIHGDVHIGNVGGVDAPSFDDARRRIRLGMVHGFYLWGITLKVDPRKTAVLLERLGTAVADHDAFDELAA